MSQLVVSASRGSTSGSDRNIDIGSFFTGNDNDNNCVKLTES